MPDAATTDRHRSPAVDYHTLADFRYRLRRFLRARELAARTAGVAPQQYLVLLQIKGSYGRELPTIGVLAERLQTQHHGVVQLVDRLVERGMVARRPAAGWSSSSGRRVRRCCAGWLATRSPSYGPRGRRSCRA